MVEYERWTSEDSPSGVEIPEGVVVRWVYDDDYRTQGSYAYESDEETRKAEDYETSKLNAGEWVALGYVVEDTHGEHYESMWGIVIEPDSNKLAEFFSHYTPTLPSTVEVAQGRYDRAASELAQATKHLIEVQAGAEK